MSKEYRTIEEVAGPIMLVHGVQGITYDEIRGIELASGERRCYGVPKIDGDDVMVQLCEAATGINLGSSKTRFLRYTMGLGTSEDMLGRVFDGMDKPIDGGSDTLPEKRIGVNDLPMNPAAGSYPEEFTQTDVPVIDGLSTLVCGQRLPIFSTSGLPHTNLTAQITYQAEARDTDEPSAVVFAAMGITFEKANFFMKSFCGTGAIDRGVILIDLVSDPAIRRIVTPRMALTTAEYLVFEKNVYVLIILTDITNYTDSLREVSVARKEVPRHRDYPGYMHTDLVFLYERAGRQEGKIGLITVIPVLTMPEDDKIHLTSDLTGHITEGQIILSCELCRKNVTPPIDASPSLSRLGDRGIGEGKTGADHVDVMNQLFAAYVRGEGTKKLMMILGEAALTDMDKLYAKFTNEFEKGYVSQGYYAGHEIEETMEIDWKPLRILPRNELKRIKGKLLDLYYDAK